MMIGSILFPIGFFIVGWTSKSSIHWFPSLVGFYFIGAWPKVTITRLHPTSRLIILVDLSSRVELPDRHVHLQIRLGRRGEYIPSFNLCRRIAFCCSTDGSWDWHRMVEHATGYRRVFDGVFPVLILEVWTAVSETHKG